MPDKSPEYFAYGIQLTWSHNNRIATITTEGDMARPAIDMWAEVTTRVIQEWPPEQVVGIIFDVSSPNQGYTPYAAKRTRDIYQVIPPHLYGYAAIVMRDNLIMRMMSFLLQRENRLLNGRATERFFTSLDEAYVWMREKLRDEADSPL